MCGGIKIYVKQENLDVLVAEWYKSKYTLHFDSPAKKESKIYAKIITKWWTVFEEENGR